MELPVELAGEPVRLGMSWRRDDAEPGQYIAGLALQTAEPLEVEGTSMFNQIIRKSIAVFIIVGASNAMNFTDGLDGLAGVIAATAFVAYGGPTEAIISAEEIGEAARRVAAP